MTSATNTPTESTGESRTDTSLPTTQQSLTDLEYETATHDTDSEFPTTGDRTETFTIPATVDLSTLAMSPTELKGAMELPYDHAADLIRTPPTEAPRFTGTIDYQTLDLLTRHLSAIADESRIAITTEGWYISLVDSRNAVQLSAWLPATDWRTYNCEQEGVIALAWAGTSGTVKSTLKHIDSGAIIEIAHADRTTTLDDGIPTELSTIDPDSTRSIPDELELTLPNSITLPGVDLNELFKRMTDITDTLTISGQPQSESIVLVAEGETAVIRKEYATAADLTEVDSRRTRRLFETFIVDNDHSTLGLEYLRAFMNAPRKRDLKTGYTCRFGDELPLQIERDLGTDGFLRYFQAPRIKPD